MNYPSIFDDLPAGVSQIWSHALLDSTSTALRQLAEEGSPCGTVVLADSQSAGRGRRGRQWHSPPGKGIYFSVLFRPEHLAPRRAAAVTLTAALSAARRLREAAGSPILLKWPNDLLIGAKKMGGILTEGKVSGGELLYLVLGIGLNINHRTDDFPATLRSSATSLYLSEKRTFERTALFLSVLESVLLDCRLFFEQGFAPFEPLWRELNTTLGKTVVLTGAGKPIRGRALDIDSAGALLLKDEDGKRRRIICGEILQEEGGNPLSPFPN